MKLENKNVVITGGSKGLGLAMALNLSKEKANVLVCAKNTEELKGLPEGIFGVQADVTKEEDVQNLMRKAKDKLGNVDIWINNAGIWTPHVPIEETDWHKRAHDLMEVNFFGTVFGSKAAMIEMKKKKSGMIVNIISTSALEGRNNSSAYSSSKFAAMGFTKALQKELEGTGVTALAIYPGGMKTNLFDEGKPDNFSEYMDPIDVAKKIIDNMKEDNPKEELIIRR